MSDCIIGVPSFGEVSIHWAMGLTAIAMPINFSNQYKVVLGKRIDEARNEVAEYVVNASDKPRFLFFLDDDVIMPPDTLKRLVHRMDNLPSDVGAVSGVYYSKSEPGEPLIFQQQGKGSDYDWRVGDFIKAWAAGCGLVLIRAEALRRMEQQKGKPWFSIDYGLSQRGDGVYEARSLTEDLYFYTKMAETKAPNGKNYSLWIDTTIQAKHYDKKSKRFFGLQPEEPQSKGRKPIQTGKNLSLAWIGCGPHKEEFIGCQVVRVDEDRSFKPDVVARGNQLPFKDNSFDIVYSAFLLHTFETKEVTQVLAEWKRILNPGGKLYVKVPDIDFGVKVSKENPELAKSIIYQGRTGLNQALARKACEEVGLKDVYVYTNKAELNILGRKGFEEKAQGTGPYGRDEGGGR